MYERIVGMLHYRSCRPQVYRLADTFLLRVPGEKSLRACRVTGKGVAVPSLPEGAASA